MDIEKHIKESFTNLIEDSLIKIIDFCRWQQGGYERGKAKASGLDVLEDLFNKDIVPTSSYDKIKEAVENYNDPYEIVVE